MRKATVEELEELINLPRNLANSGAPEDMTWDMSKIYDNPKNIGFMSKAGAMIFGYEGSGVFECHFLFRFEASGRAIKEAATAMLEEMFTNYGACVIKGYPPRGNRAVRVMGIALGFKKITNAEFIDDLGRPCVTYELRKVDG